MTTANESSFRASLASIGWSRRQPDSDISTAQPSFFQRINPFNQTGHIRLPTTEQDVPPTQLPAPTAQEEAGAWFALSQWDRMIVFACCVLGAVVCFVMAFVLMPILALKPRKFVTLWTVGSILFLCRHVIFYRRVWSLVLLLYKVPWHMQNILFRQLDYRLQLRFSARWDWLYSSRLEYPPWLVERLMIVTFYDIDFIICDCPDYSFSELLCVLCPWRHSRIALWRKDCT